jgi:hypothetical protein
MRKSDKFFMVLIAVIGWFALLLQLFLSYPRFLAAGRTQAGAVLQFLSYFTILSNLLLTLSFSWQVAFPKSRAGNFFSRPSVGTGITLYLLVVGIVYNLVLRGLWKPVGIDRVADELLHVLLPGLALLFWFLFTPKGMLKTKQILLWLIYPLLYTPFVMIRGALVGHYPYPFLDLQENSLARVCLNMGLITAGFLFLGTIFYFADKYLGKVRRAVR